MKQLYPRAFIEEKIALSRRTDQNRQRIAALIAEAEGLLRKHPDEAKKKAEDAERALQTLQREIACLKEKERAFDEARSTYRQRLDEAEKAVEETRIYLVTLSEAGYRVDPAKELDNARGKVMLASQMLLKESDVPDYEAVIAHAKRAEADAVAVKKRWQDRVAAQKQNEKALHALKEWRQDAFPSLRASHVAHIAELKKKTPEALWSPVAANTAQAERAFEASAETILADAERLNGMEAQDFENAASYIKELRRLKSDVEAAYQQPEATLASYNKTKEKITALVGQATNKIKSAERAVKDSGAEGAGKDDLHKAKSQLSEAENLMKSPFPNWIALTAAVSSVIALAEAAERSAKNRANAVETKKRRDREDDERRRRDSYASSSSSSWSSGSSHSGGGFGGGSFGGGGASGKW